LRNHAVVVLIVLDTNCFFGDVYAKRAWLTAVLDGAEQGDFDVVVPAAVVMELVKQYPARLSEAVQSANSAVGKVLPELRRLNVEPPARVEADEGALIAAYEERLRERLTGPGRRIAPLPSDLGPAVEWAVNRRAPFKTDGKDGEGTPDASIWLTVLELAADSDEVVLASANKHDFGDGGDPPALHPDLVSDLVARGLPADRVRLVTSVRTLVEEVVAPLAEADARASRMLTDPAVSHRLGNALIDALAYSPLPQEGLRLGVELDSDPQATSLDFDEIQVVSARQSGDGRLLLELRALADLLLDVLVFRGDYYAVEETTPIAVTNPDWNEHYIEGEAAISAWLTLEVATDLNADEVEVAVAEARRLSDEEMIERRLAGADGERLLDELRRPAEGRRMCVDHYLPPIPLQSDIESAEVEGLGAGSVRLDSVDDVDEGFACTLVIDAEGDVQWLVSAPSPFDLEKYAGLAEGAEDAGGFLTDVAQAEPLVLLVSAVLRHDGTWDDIDIHEIALEPEELERRASDGDPALDEPPDAGDRKESDGRS
jgi:predicted nucleic acid-binding protein